MLALRLIDPNDYTVHEDGQRIGRIRHNQRALTGPLALDNGKVSAKNLSKPKLADIVPGASSGDAATLDDAKP